MTKEEMLKRAEKFDAKAEAAGIRYQMTGLNRYGYARNTNQDLAEVFRIAANAADDHAQLISLRCDVAARGARAQDLLAGELLNVAYCDARVKALLVDVAAVASAYHLLRRR